MPRGSANRFLGSSSLRSLVSIWFGPSQEVRNGLALPVASIGWYRLVSQKLENKGLRMLSSLFHLQISGSLLIAWEDMADHPNFLGQMRLGQSDQ